MLDDESCRSMDDVAVVVVVEWCMSTVARELIK